MEGVGWSLEETAAHMIHLLALTEEAVGRC